MSALRDFAAGLTRTWVALYTSGLPAELREARRAEIDSDLWEQRQVAGLHDEPPGETAFQLLARLAFGIPADLLWRLDAGRSASSNRRTIVNESWTARGLLTLALAVSAFAVVIGLMAAVGVNGDFGNATERAIFGAIQIAAGVAIMAGLLMSAKKPVLGICLVATGAITMSALWYWALVITIPVGLGLVAIAYVRGRTARQRPQPGPA